MIDASEIDFLNLSAKQFEELCFDLLDELGFSRLTWRQGGADDGRDIQGVLMVRTGLVEPFEEDWFFECKRYENGVPPEQLNSKIAWADAEKPKHYVFFISSYVTRGAREWLEKIKSGKPYKIHLIEGKQLQTMVFRHQILLQRYFSSSAQTLMQEAHRAWLHHYLVPEPWMLRTLAESKNLNYYSTGQLAFLWAALKVRSEELVANMEDSYGESYDVIFGLLKRQSTMRKTVLKESESYGLINEVETESHFDLIYTKIFAAEIFCIVGQAKSKALYCLVRDNEGEGLEVIVKQDNNLTYRIRHIPNSARSALTEAKRILHGE